MAVLLMCVSLREVSNAHRLDRGLCELNQRFHSGRLTVLGSRVRLVDEGEVDALPPLGEMAALGQLPPRRPCGRVDRSLIIVQHGVSVCASFFIFRIKSFIF